MIVTLANDDSNYGIRRKLNADATAMFSSPTHQKHGAFSEHTQH